MSNPLKLWLYLLLLLPGKMSPSFKVLSKLADMLPALSLCGGGVVVGYETKVIFYLGRVELWLSCSFDNYSGLFLFSWLSLPSLTKISCNGSVICM